MITIEQLQKHLNYDYVYNDYVNLSIISFIINNEINIETIKKLNCAQKYIKQCHNMPNDIDIKLEVINYLLNGFGLEPINDENVYVDSYWNNCIAIYINMGDSYIPTIIYDTQEKEFILTTYADFIEKHEKRVDK